jgi:hypothetical protein
MLNSIPARSSYYFRLTFWRVAAQLTEFAIKNKDTIQRLLPYTPYAGFGALAYFAGWLVGEIIQAVIA